MPRLIITTAMALNRNFRVVDHPAAIRYTLRWDSISSLEALFSSDIPGRSSRIGASTFVDKWLILVSPTVRSP